MFISSLHSIREINLILSLYYHCYGNKVAETVMFMYHREPLDSSAASGLEARARPCD